MYMLDKAGAIFLCLPVGKCDMRFLRQYHSVEFLFKRKKDCVIHLVTQSL